MSKGLRKGEVQAVQVSVGNTPGAVKEDETCSHEAGLAIIQSAQDGHLEKAESSVNTASS